VPLQPHHRDIATWHLTEPVAASAMHLPAADRFHTTLSTAQAQIRLERAPTTALPSADGTSSSAMPHLVHNGASGPARVLVLASPRGPADAERRAAAAEGFTTSSLAHRAPQVFILWRLL
jgi:hypothetical protein